MLGKWLNTFFLILILWQCGQLVRRRLGGMIRAVTKPLTGGTSRDRSPPESGVVTCSASFEREGY
eukprot:3851770-Amphidinium_carterae.1